MAQILNIPLGLLEINEGQVEGLPQNPRFIKDEKFELLKKSLTESPEMLSLRELIVYPHNGSYVVIGGNMRLRAARELGFAELPCKVLPKDTSIDKLKEYVIKDNNGYGQDDFDILANEWEDAPLTDWGMDLPAFEGMNEDSNKEQEATTQSGCIVCPNCGEVIK